MSSQGDIKKEIAEGFEIFAIRKTLRSLWTFVLKPRQVVDSLYQGKAEYVKPVRFILTIGAPALLILNLFDVDVRGAVGQVLTDGFLTQYDTDHISGYLVQVIHELFITFATKIVGEYNPLMYFGAGPIVALIIRKIHPDKSLRFYFFLALSWYMLGVYCLVDLTETVVFGSTGWELPDWENLLRFLFSIYVVVSIMPGKMLSRIVRAILAIVLGWISILSIFTVIIVTILGLWVKNTDWVPTKTTGYSLMKISDSLSQVYGIKEGLCVASVAPDSPADRAGVREGDVLVSLENDHITSFKNERIALEAIPMGDSISLVVNRKGEVVRLRVVVVPWDSVFRNVAIGYKYSFDAMPVTVGGFHHAARITGVATGSPAELADLRVDDRIVWIDGDSIHSRRAFRVASNRYGQKRAGDTTRFMIWRQDSLFQIAIIMQSRHVVYPGNQNNSWR